MNTRNIHQKGKNKLYLLCFTALKYRSKLKFSKQNCTFFPVVLLTKLKEKKKMRTIIFLLFPPFFSYLCYFAVDK